MSNVGAVKRCVFYRRANKAGCLPEQQNHLRKGLDMNIIEVQNLKKSYGRFQAVKGISFHVEEGALFSFLGPNGAGKSTTIDTLCTLNPFDEGNVTIAGYDLKTQQNDIRKKIGVVFQDNLMDRMLTVRENLKIRASFYHSDSKKLKSAVDFAAKHADVQEFIDRPYGKLSGGQRRRVDIARALLNTPQVLFLDEPTTGLDPQTRKHVWETVQRLQKKNGMTIFLTTHYMEEAALSDYIVVIDGGEIVAKGTPYELKEKYTCEHLRVKPKDRASLLKYLKSTTLRWKNDAELIDIEIANTMDALPILDTIRKWIESLEILHGTMDDVFLNITGKELRE